MPVVRAAQTGSPRGLGRQTPVVSRGMAGRPPGGRAAPRRSLWAAEVGGPQIASRGPQALELPLEAKHTHTDVPTRLRSITILGRRACCGPIIPEAGFSMVAWNAASAGQTPGMPNVPPHVEKACRERPEWPGCTRSHRKPSPFFEQRFPGSRLM